jgi:group I intron endonuclease
MLEDYTGFKYLQPRINKFRKLAEITKKSVAEQLQELNNLALLSNPSGKSGVYVFHSKINDFIYIGSAVNLRRRRQEHIEGLKMNQHLNWGFQMLYHKYGFDNISFYIMEFCSSQERLNREVELIQEYDPEINIAGGRWETLGLGFSSMEEKDRVMEEWYQTTEGFEWKRKWALDWGKSHRGLMRSDMRNLWERLSIKNLSEEEMFIELLKHYKAYLPEKLWEKEALIEYIKGRVQTISIKKI